MEEHPRLLNIFDILLLDKNKESIEETTKWLNKIDIHKLLKLDNLNNHYLLAVILKNLLQGNSLRWVYTHGLLMTALR